MLSRKEGAGRALQVLADFSSQCWKSSWARYKKNPKLFPLPELVHRVFEARQPVSKDADGAAQKRGLTWAHGARRKYGRNSASTPPSPQPLNSMWGSCWKQFTAAFIEAVQLWDCSNTIIYKLLQYILWIHQIIYFLNTTAHNNHLDSSRKQSARFFTSPLQKKKMQQKLICCVSWEVWTGLLLFLVTV